MRRLLDQDARAGSLFEAHRGSVRVREGIDLIASPRCRARTPKAVEKSSRADPLLLDTHIALWLDSSEDHLLSSNPWL